MRDIDQLKQLREGVTGPRVRWPGLPVASLGVERYCVPGGGAVAFRVAAGDRVRVIDVEGGQPCELVEFGSNKKRRRLDWALPAMAVDRRGV